MDNSTLNPYLQSEGFTITKVVCTCLMVTTTLFSSVFSLLLFKSTFLQDHHGIVTLPLRCHLFNVIYQLVIQMPATCTYLYYPQLYLESVTCLVIAQMTAYTVYVSLSNTCFYAIAIHLYIVRPLHVHVWFSPKRRLLSVLLVHLVPALYASVPSMVFFATKNEYNFELTHCFTNIFSEIYLNTVPVVGALLFIFLTYVTTTIIMTSRRQAKQVATLSGCVNAEANGLKSKHVKTFLIVIGIAAVVLLTFIAVNIVVVNCHTPVCLHVFLCLVYATCCMDGVVLTIVKFRLGPTRLKELWKSFKDCCDPHGTS